MPNQNPFTNSINDTSIQEKMEDIWRITCGSWQNCKEATIQSFLSQCYEYNIDPQFCFNWIEQHKNEISNWSTILKTSLDWVNQHTSTGSPISMTE
ncbi:hypothetical protein [Peribacillus tepidiphilus]|uniref:hypothetical protein n=1 Tax=Peribacillus tepidiphilus TaxID=2652445 RepID=UPI0012921B77|nr:hypothetical protein [Peribacillus tepidiphilus]